MVLAMFVFPEQSLKDSVCVDEVPSRGENGWNHCSALPAEVGTRLLHISFQHSFKCNPCGVCSALPTVWVAPIAEVSFFQRSSRLECLRSRLWLGAPFLVMTVLRSVDGACLSLSSRDFSLVSTQGGRLSCQISAPPCAFILTSLLPHSGWNHAGWGETPTCESHIVLRLSPMVSALCPPLPHLSTL